MIKEYKRPPDPSTAAYDINGFCKAHNISRALYYKLRTEGRGPRETRVTPTKPIITLETAAEWRQRIMEEGTFESA
jgi:hypothetical protein